MQKIKRNDEVIVIAGKDKGRRGKVIGILDNNRLLVSGVQMVKKHTRPNPQAGKPGGILEKEASIQLSNVAIFNPATEKADRVGFKFLEENSGVDKTGVNKKSIGKKNKVRIFKSSGEPIDT